jgi:hypothetical protein
MAQSAWKCAIQSGLNAGLMILVRNGSGTGRWQLTHWVADSQTTAPAYGCEITNTVWR